MAAQSALGPGLNETMGQAAARRTHAPELLVGGPAVQEHLPFAEFTPESQTVEQPPKFVA